MCKPQKNKEGALQPGKEDAQRRRPSKLRGFRCSAKGTRVSPLLVGIFLIDSVMLSLAISGPVPPAFVVSTL
ncbi:hypothetical protein NDU88_001751 [Pleurodeles waltl]|uniref:Uncharacterized protein n=1 Tax=Pleurodeles waltl TaxID=8319 RepID=A0AAV7U7W0_PLEWA|nr:hypothetical protein NDU88_001751 [Pleurodeles waltl]